MSGQENKFKNAALVYASFGLYVHPLKPGAKTPALKGWRESATTDQVQISAWWDENPLYNVGIATGDKSRLLVIDYDTGNGKNGLQVREERASGFPITWTAKTAHGGVHEFYRTPTPGRNKAGLYGCVDTRGEGGYVVAPPSIVDGLPYTWQKPPVLFTLADADASVFAFISPISEDGNSDNQRREPYRVPDEITEGGRTSALVALAGSLIGKGLTPEAAEAAIREENERKCSPPLTDEELEKTVLPSLYRPEWQHDTVPYNRDLPINAAILERVRALDPANCKRYGQNDAGSARLFMDVCGDTVQFVGDRRRWFSYDGQKWDIDGEADTKEKLKSTADALTLYALRDLPDDNRRTEYLKFAAKWQQLRTRETILKDAQSIHQLNSADFDNDPYLLNCNNGVLNLRDMSFHGHNPKDRLSKLATVAYNPSARCERWEQFIGEVTGGDNTLAAYIQKALGYSLTGDTRQECFFILYGATSRNGKSTMTETFSRLMGDYAAAARPETIAKKKFANGSGPTEDVARLAGVRFVSMAEPAKDLELDAALVKSLTGRDTITARRLNEGSFEYTPAFKLFLNCNHRPRVDDLTVFASDRVKLIPFNVHFTEHQRDPYLKDKLTNSEALSGILNWCIAGLQALRREGLAVPDAVRAATSDYQRKEDKIMQFLEEKAETGNGFEVPLLELHSEFSNWCSVSGLMPCGIPKFKEMLEEKQFCIRRKRPAGQGRQANPILTVLNIRLLPK